MAKSFNEIFEESVEAQANSTPVPVVPSTNKILESATSSEDFIFCSECGHKIKSHSKFCRFCGAKADEEYASSEVENPNKLSADNSKSGDKSHSSIQERIIYTSKPLEVRIKSKSTVKKSKVANEIIANLKMIGCAILTWLVYIGAFYVYHQDDIKELKVDSNDTDWGESCYDPEVMSGGGEMNPEKIYNSLKYYETNTGGYYYGNVGTGVEYINISSSETVPDQYKNDPLYKQAVEEANRNKTDFLDNINSIRQSGFKEDLSKHAIWSAIICLLLFVIGRYLIVSIKWIDNNRSK